MSTLNPQGVANLSRAQQVACLAAVLCAFPGSVAAQEAVEYYATDAVGSVRVVFDGAGNVSGRMDFEPFGRELYQGLFMPGERFAQLTRDSESELDYAEARMFQARTGRFTATDPIWHSSHETQSWNRYTYGLNNPFRFVDPRGTTPIRVQVVGYLPRGDWDFAAEAWAELRGGRVRQAGGPSGGPGTGPAGPGPGGPTGPGPSGPTGPGPGGPDGPNNPPGPGGSSCEQFTQNLTEFITGGTGGLISRVANLPFRAAKVGKMAMDKAIFGTRIPVRAPGVSGFKPELTAFGQDEDVYKHGTFVVGAMNVPNGPIMAAIFTGYDFLESQFHPSALHRAQSSAEVQGDIAGVKTGAAVWGWAMTGDVDKLRRRTRAAFCQ